MWACRVTLQSPLVSVCVLCGKGGFSVQQWPVHQAERALHICPSAGTLPSEGFLAACKVRSHFASPLSSTCVLLSTPFPSPRTHVPQRLHLICSLQLPPCDRSYCKAHYKSNNVVCVFDPGNFCHFHLWSRVCLKNLGCWLLLPLQRMEGETQICQEAFVHAG